LLSPTVTNRGQLEARPKSSGSALDLSSPSPLSFLPGVMLAMVASFQHSQFGVELGSLLLIFYRTSLEHCRQLVFFAESVPPNFTKPRSSLSFHRPLACVSGPTFRFPRSVLSGIHDAFWLGWFFLWLCEMCCPRQASKQRLPAFRSWVLSCRRPASSGNTKHARDSLGVPR